MLDAIKFRKNVHIYETAYALIDDNTTAKEWNAITELLPGADQHDIFKNLEDDYESYSYLLLDFETVVMTVDHDVVRTWESVKDFILDTVAEVNRVYYDRLITEESENSARQY